MKMNNFKKYALSYGVSVAQAIADRDEPASLEQCCIWFVEAEGRKPTPAEMELMRPDSAETIQRQIDYYRE